MLTSSTPTAATLTLHLAGLQPSLLAASGLPEPLASALVTEMLPLLLEALGNPDQLGSPATVWALCRRLYETGAHVSLPALLREDEDWPAQRRQLAEALLGTTGLRAFQKRHQGKANAEPVAQLAGRLSTVLLATAGQCSYAKDLDAAALHEWLRPQAPTTAPATTPTTAPAAMPEPTPAPVAAHLPTVAATAVVSVAEPMTEVAEVAEMAAETAEKTETTELAQAGPAWRQQLSKWWSLTGLVLLAVGGGSYYLSRPTGPAATPTATLTATPLAEPRAYLRPIPVVAVTPPAEPASTATSAPAHPASVAAQPVVKLAAASLPSSGKEAKQRPHPAGHARPVLARHTPQRPAAGQNDEAPGDKQLYQRLAQPDPANRQMLDLDHLTFEQGQTTLDAEGVQRLKKVAALLRKFPRSRLIVFGNAEPAEPQPLVLALNRAQTVVNELLKQGAPTGVLQAQGRMRPAAAATNDPDSGRRIALYISPLAYPPAH